MSLNWREIDLVLSELDLEGAKVERILQPGFDSLSLGLYKAGATTELFISIAQGACRVHALSAPPPKPTRPLRFMECLRSRIRGARIVSVAQMGRERVVRIELSAPRAEGEEGGLEFRRYVLYARLWSGAGNVVLVDGDGIVVDALARRPKRGEISGERCAIEEELARAVAAREEASRTGSGPAARDFEPRDLPGEGGFNRRVEAHYARTGGALSRDGLLESARERSARRTRALEARIAELEGRAAEYRDADRLRELGDMLMSCPDEALGGRFADCDDVYRGGRISVPVDPSLSRVENARSYYERHRKARSGLGEVEAQIGAARAEIAKIGRELAELESLADPFLIARALAKGGAAPAERGGAPRERAYPGLSLESSGWTIIVGRSAKENDELLRTRIRGSDLWLHARDWPGSYVFVKARKGKTVPLEVLLDAGMLAIYYSKGRSGGRGDLYYTFAKYLRRAKDGPKGTVIPTQEKNLSVTVDEARVKELRALMGEPD